MRTRYYAASTGFILAALIIISVTIDVVVQAASLKQQPAVVSAVAPVYPSIAVAVNAGGAVETEVEVNIMGEVVSVRGTSGHPLLRRAAETAARHWRFTPAVSTRVVRLTFIFRIMKKDTPAESLTPVFTPPYQVEVRHREPEPIVDTAPLSSAHPARRCRKRRTR